MDMSQIGEDMGAGVPVSPEDPTATMNTGGMPSDGGMPQPMPEMGGLGSEPMPEEDMEEPIEESSGGSKTDGLKRQLLEKMMSNLLNKPGRSVNEMVNGVKAVIGAYKNYSKEWDSLNGVDQSELQAPAPGASQDPTSGGDIKEILAKIQESKGGAQPPMPEMMPQGGAPQGGAPIAVPEMPPQGAGGPGYNTPPPVSRLGIWGY